MQTVGQQTEVFARFSTVGGGQDSSDYARDPRGFALKFYTGEGNYDIVGNNTPIFFLRDVLIFLILLIHKRKAKKKPTCLTQQQCLSFGQIIHNHYIKLQS